MDIVLGIIGFVVGIFLWANVFGSLLATLPLQLGLKRAGAIPKINWFGIIAPTIFALAVLGISAVLSQAFFLGTLPACVVMFLNLGKLKKEAASNLPNDQ